MQPRFIEEFIKGVTVYINYGYVTALGVTFGGNGIALCGESRILLIITFFAVNLSFYARQQVLL